MRYDRGWGARPPYDDEQRLQHAYRGFERASAARNPEPRGDIDDGRFGPARYGLGPYHERLQRLAPSDEELKTAVEESLFFDTWVDADSIEVAVQDGIVTLKGTLPDYQEVRYATDDVWDVAGVKGLRCELSVADD